MHSYAMRYTLDLKTQYSFINESYNKFLFIYLNSSDLSDIRLLGYRHQPIYYLQFFTEYIQIVFLLSENESFL